MITHPARIKVILAFAAVYVIWGSTYLAIRFAVETLPPFIMAGTRFVLAGTALYLWVRSRGATRPTLTHWRSATIVAALLLLVGNGGVSWAEQFVPSGITALLIAITPLWFVVLEWWFRGVRPTAVTSVGLVLGSIGVLILVDPAELVGGEQVHLWGALALLIATICWVAGSLYSRRVELPSSPLLATAMEMLAGGVLLVLSGLVAGEASTINLSSIAPRSFLALAYLTVFGSLIAFTAYVWLLNTVQPTLVSTYAYVNPVIAVFLGWLIGNEPISTRTLVAAGIIVAAVGLITTLGSRKSTLSGGASPASDS